MKLGFKDRILQIALLGFMLVFFLYRFGELETETTSQTVIAENAPIMVLDVNADFKKKELLVGPWKYTMILEDGGFKTIASGFEEYNATGEFAGISDIQILGPGEEVVLEVSLEIDGKWNLVNSSVFYSSVDISIRPSADGLPPPFTLSEISEWGADMESSPMKILKIDDCVMLTEEDGELVSYNKYYYESNGYLKPKC